MPGRRHVTGRAGFRWTYLVVVLGVVLPVAWLWAARIAPVSDGTLVLSAPDASTVVLARVYSDDSTLQAGDTVVAVDGVSVDEWVAGHGTGTTPRVGGSATYTVLRAGQIQ